MIRTDWLLFFHILRIAFYCRIDIQANIIPTLTRNYAWIDVKISPCFKPSRRSNETRMHIGYTISFSHDRTRVIYLQLTYIYVYILRVFQLYCQLLFNTSLWNPDNCALKTSWKMYRTSNFQSKIVSYIFIFINMNRIAHIEYHIFHTFHIYIYSARLNLNIYLFIRMWHKF